MSIIIECDLQCNNDFKTGRACYSYHKPITIALYNKEVGKHIYDKNITINQDHGERYITQAQFNKWQQEVNKDKRKNYEYKWSPIFGICIAQWMFPFGHAIAKQKRCKPSGWVSVLKKRYRKEKYDIKDFDHFYLDPFDNGTLIQDATPNDQSTKLKDEFFITGPRLAFNHD
jgi:hypothetical protein